MGAIFCPLIGRARGEGVYPAVHHPRHSRHPHRPLHVHVLHHPPQVCQLRPGHTQDRPVGVRMDSR